MLDLLRSKSIFGCPNRRVSPLEFGLVDKTPDGVPIYHGDSGGSQNNRQKRGGTLGFGGVYGGGDEEQEGRNDYDEYASYDYHGGSDDDGHGGGQAHHGGGGFRGDGGE